MSISKHDIPNISFFLLFPCSFFYYVFLSLNIIPSFPLGYFTIVASLLVVPLFFSYLFLNIVNIKQSIIFDFLFFIYLIYYIAVNFVTINDDFSLYIRHLGTILYHLTVFLVFRGINIDSKPFYNFNAIFIVRICMTILVLTKESVFLLPVEGAGLQHDRASYQFIALVYLICSVIFLSGDYKWAARFVFYVASIAALYFNGARSEFIVFILIIVLAEFIKSDKRLRTMTVGLISISIFVALMFLYKDSLNSSNRIVDLLINTTQNESSRLRAILSENAIETIHNNPVFGGFASYEKGHYAHNILSVWVDLGAFGFILYCTMLAIPFFYVSYLIIIKKRRTKMLFIITCFIYASIFLLIFAKAFYYLLVPASFGLFSNYLSRFNLRGCKYLTPHLEVKDVC